MKHHRNLVDSASRKAKPTPSTLRKIWIIFITWRVMNFWWARRDVVAAVCVSLAGRVASYPSLSQVTVPQFIRFSASAFVWTLPSPPPSSTKNVAIFSPFCSISSESALQKWAVGGPTGLRPGWSWACWVIKANKIFFNMRHSPQSARCHPVFPFSHFPRPFLLVCLCACGKFAYILLDKH